MRILVISDFETSGGAARATSNLCYGLIDEGHEVYRLVVSPDKKQDDNWKTIHFYNRKSLFGIVCFFLFIKLPFSLKEYISLFRFKRILKSLKPQVINFHNILWAKNIGVTQRFYLAASKFTDTYITMHDEWNLKGVPYEVCHPKVAYPEIIYYNYHGDVITRQKALENRKSIFNSQSKLNLIAPSKWLYRVAHEMQASYEYDCYHIPYGINSLKYKAINKKIAREVLNLPLEKVLLLYSANSLTYYNKGYWILQNCLERLNHEDVFLVSIGGGNGANISTTSYEHLGFISDEVHLSLVYSAADVLAFPSLADNLPNSILESLICGTPVAAFQIGGIPDMVINGVTGWIADEISETGYLEILEKAINDVRNGVNMSENCIRKILTDFSVAEQAKKYLALFMKNESERNT